MNRIEALNIPEKNTETFLDFNQKSKTEIQKLCSRFYNSKINQSQIEEFLQITDKEVQKILTFAMDAFKEKKRKDGQYLVTHSLRLVKDAKYLNISDEEIVKLVLLHDIVEDTEFSLEDIRKKFGDKMANLSEFMIEKRISDNRDLSLITFVEQLKRGGKKVAIAEILDRIDDITDLDYLTKDIKNMAEENKNEIYKKLAKKFAKCKYAIESVTENFEKDDDVLLKKTFKKLFFYQINECNIPMDLIQEYSKNYKRR
ncbi:hypothetical protein CO134_01255 [Candidatus Kuenenbacteria bacterium CG_4_9_14_3_um_filter_39_14]|uniref:HD domain-containing protein n=4 Tax=Candidatus Kueneniibacteriota TaxID=1752740 RepID=A0A2M7MGA0_9BACT|nr:MAG: hypothetical protein COW86_03110 [Candidatus Kuenenbacteria bacterium CG22_combo_CG10-13_8_21_14_all_39_9]PIR81036.1 MAG: hypothetical protein COU24_00770 [Candidatus Kuenenbacteria bacterium CG10_big_fil_rev_8_21_14_0_10_39_14]PIX92134.1 MAG: hypothetical protein COZ26_03465 [Candidatus Kuenenbacteria bacterium CG_4_10_14_3_um_filter_39_14]PJA92234.1 MAG: hypothetical protein CO134_01255 [Candidatus Kuenenbacteria bacterium CG_4_9_14_3_um_filter_39_14]